MTAPHKVTLSLGSNMGDRYAHLIHGMLYLFSHGLTFLRCSGVYETDPVGFTQQPSFFNTVVQAETALTPMAVLDVCQNAEKERQRERTVRWGPRTLDIDILLYDELHLDLPELTIPHPRMSERAFVLGPLEEMDPLLFRKWGFPRLVEGIRLQIPAEDLIKEIL